MPAPYILSIDNGTQSVRALLFDTRGALAAKAQVMLEPYFSAHPGWAEHDVDGYWQAVCTACQRLWADSGIAASAVAGVAVTTQRGTVFQPHRDHQRIYDRLYRRVYKKMYARLQPLYRDIADITGYPAP